MLFTNHCRYATYFSFKIQTSLIGVGTKNHNSHVKQSPQNMLFVRNVSMFNLCCILIKFPHDQNAKPPQFNRHINKVGEGFNCPFPSPLLSSTILANRISLSLLCPVILQIMSENSQTAATTNIHLTSHHFHTLMLVGWQIMCARKR